MPKPWELPKMPEITDSPRQVRKAKRWCDLHLAGDERFKNGVDRLAIFISKNRAMEKDNSSK